MPSSQRLGKISEPDSPTLTLDARAPNDDWAAVLGTALSTACATLDRLPGRPAASGLHEVRELAPALRGSLAAEIGGNYLVSNEHEVPISDWSRATSRCDVVVLDRQGDPALAAELKVWDIGHQLFDAAKIACLLKAGARTGFLVSVAEDAQGFDRSPAGILFPARLGEGREHDFPALLETAAAEWHRHVGHGGPEPTAVSRRIRTTAVAVGVSVPAYPGHMARAVEVEVSDATPVSLDGV